MGKPPTRATQSAIKAIASQAAAKDLAQADRLRQATEASHKLKTHARTTDGRYRAKTKTLKPDGSTPPPAEEAGLGEPGAPE